MDTQAMVLLAGSLNLLASLIGFPVLWDRVNHLRGEVAELRANLRQLEISRSQPPSSQGDRPNA